MLILYKRIPIYFFVHFSIIKEIKLSALLLPNFEVIVKLPCSQELSDATSFIKKNAAQIVKKKYFEGFINVKYSFIYPKRLIFIIYLGKRYKICTIKSSNNLVRLYRGTLYLYTSQPLNFSLNKTLLRNWIHNQASIKLEQKFNDCILNFRNLASIEASHINIKITGLKYKLFKYDAKNYILELNYCLINTPTCFVDYVISYALSSIICRNHNEIYDTLCMVLPKAVQKVFIML